MRIPVPKPASVGLILSYKCNAICRHCMYACTPKWSADWVNEDDLRIFLKQLSGSIVPSPYGPQYVTLSHGLHFTGGEPFLNFPLLCMAVVIASEYEIPSTFVETNCFWCTDDDTTHEKLSLLHANGLKGIMISVNPFYLEYVPFERTERCARISNQIFGQNTMVYQWEYFQRFKRLGIRDKVPLEEYLELDNQADFFREVEFFMMGRAAYQLGEELTRNFPKYSIDILSCQACYPPFLRDWHNHVDNYGNYMPGFCGGISLGNCRELSTLLRKGIELDDFPVLGYIIQENFKGLVIFAQQNGYQADPDGYYSKCHLCIDIRKHLVQNGKFGELKPEQLYRHLL